MKKIIYALLASALVFQSVGCADTTKQETEILEQETYSSYLEHGDNLFKQKKYEKALENYQKAYDKDNSKPQIYACLYKVYIELNQKEDSENIQMQAKEILDEEKYKTFLELIGKSENKPEESTSLQFSKAVDQISVYTGTKINYNDYFEGKSNNDFTITFDDSNVNLNKEGEYTLIVTLTDQKGKSLKKEVIVTVMESEYEYSPGMYISLYRMNVRSEANGYASVEGSFAENLEVVVDKVVKADDGSYWAVLSTGYVCIKNSQGEYLTYNRNRVPVAADFNNDNNAFIDQVCPAVNGLGGARGSDTFVGNVNRTMSCDNVFIVY